MSEPLNWRIPPEAEDWQCDWESSRRFQIRYWASLPLRAKLEAIEEMDDIAAQLGSRLREDSADKHSG